MFLVQNNINTLIDSSKMINEKNYSISISGCQTFFGST